MQVCFVCGYYPDLAHNNISRRPENYWNAYFFVWAVKVGTHRRDFYVINREGKHIQITKQNFSDARQMFGRFVANRVEELGWGAASLIVPVPSKDAIIGAGRSRALDMVTEAMATTAHKDAVCDALRWTKAIPKAHEGGERRRDQIKPFLKVVEDVTGRDLVLVDDLLSRGGTMLAAKEKLEEAGARVLGAVTCGRTIYDFETKPFGRQSFELIDELDDFNKAAIRG